MYAAWNGRAECVKALIGKEAGMQTTNGQTALMKAAKNGKKDCVRLLLEKEKNMKDKNGRNARWYADSKCVKLLTMEEECVCSNNLFDAAKKGCHACCRKFLD